MVPAPLLTMEIWWSNFSICSKNHQPLKIRALLEINSWKVAGCINSKTEQVWEWLNRRPKEMIRFWVALKRRAALSAKQPMRLWLWTLWLTLTRIWQIHAVQASFQSARPTRLSSRRLTSKPWLRKVALVCKAPILKSRSSEWSRIHPSNYSLKRTLQIGITLQR